MPTNFPGPYEVRFKYVTTVSGVALNHIQRLSLELTADPTPGDLFSTIDAELNGGVGTSPLDVVVEAWSAAAAGFYSNGSGNTWQLAELWKYEAGTYNASFIGAHATGDNGTSATTTQEAAQSIVTFRTTAGGVFKLSFMEPVVSPGSIDPLPITNAALAALVTAITGGVTYPWIGLDGGWPFVALAHFPGQNEKLWKKRRRAAI